MSRYNDNKDSFLEPKVTQYGSRMVMTNVHKPTKTKYWNIDTQFRDDYADYSKNGPILLSLPEQINDVKSITVSALELPMSFYNITAAMGTNLFQIIDASNTKFIIDVSDGYYDASGIVSAINTSLTNLGLLITMSIVNNRTIFTSATGTYTFNFAMQTQLSCSNVNGSVATFDKYNLKTKLGWLLGFRNITYMLDVNKSIQSEGVYNFNSRYLYLVVDEFISSNPNSFISPLSTSLINKNILAKIILDEVTYQYGTTFPACENLGRLISDTRTYSGCVNIQRLKVQIVNEYGLPVDLNGLDFSFCLVVEYE